MYITSIKKERIYWLKIQHLNGTKVKIDLTKRSITFLLKKLNYMKKKIKYSNEEIGKVEVVKDFLPKPEDLVFREDMVKVTLNLSKSSVEFFKELAEEHGTQYQKVIRNLLDRYTSRYSE
jgi:predicted DNA binding CopG/RHH family protein